jgi:hypothetical protein
MGCFLACLGSVPYVAVHNSLITLYLQLYYNTAALHIALQHSCSTHSCTAHGCTQPCPVGT